MTVPSAVLAFVQDLNDDKRNIHAVKASHIDTGATIGTPPLSLQLEKTDYEVGLGFHDANGELVATAWSRGDPAVTWIVRDVPVVEVAPAPEPAAEPAPEA